MVLDNFKKTSMRIDKANQRFLDYQNAKVGDVNGRELLVQITNNGVVEDQTGTTLKLNWQHENGNQDSTNFKAVDIKTGKYSLYYPKEMLYKGTVDASVEINSNGQITHTMNFKIIVHGDVFNGEAGTVNGVFISLADVNKKLDDREKEYVELRNRQTSVETQFNDIQQDITDKDPISAPEIIAARNGEANLKARLDKEKNEVTTELAQTDNKLKSESLKSSQMQAQTRNVSDIKTMVTFIDDDGYDGVLDILKPMFTARGVPYVIALRGDAVILQTEEKREQLRDLQNNHGWEMASHTAKHIHLDSSTDKEIEEDSTNFLNLMHDYGLDVESIVYPWGERGNTSIISKYYRAGFGTTNGVNNDITLDDYAIGREILGNSSTRDLQFFKDMIDSIDGKPRWLVFMTHVSDPATNVQQIEDVVDYLISKNIPIVTAKEGLKHYGSLLNSRTNVPSNHADYKYTRIKPNGHVDTNRYLMNYAGAGINGIKITGASKPSDFDIGVTTTTHINSVADNLPFNGILTTTKTIVTNGFVRQELSEASSSMTSATSRIYRTSLTNSDSWSNWQSVNGYLWFTPTEETPPSEYPFGETYRQITGWSTGTGVVKTINVIPSQLHYMTQVFYRTLGHRTLVRGVSGSGQWTDWKEVQFL